MVSSVFSSDRADFGFKIDFVRDTEDPDRVFRTLSGLIEFCVVTDQILIQSLDCNLENTLLLDNIEQGSITVWLKNSLKFISDSSRYKNLRYISEYLVRGKTAIIDFINTRDTIKDNKEFLNLKDRIETLATETQTNLLGIYQAPHERDLLSSIDKFQAASSELKTFDQLYYLTKKSVTPINKNFALSEDAKEHLLVKETVESELTLILKVKKPDYLGESKWQFRHGNRTIDIKVNDLEWLKEFRERKFFISPGDAIKAQVKTVEKYDFAGELISTQFTLQKVIEVIPMPVGTQLSLFDDNT